MEVNHRVQKQNFDFLWASINSFAKLFFGLEDFENENLKILIRNKPRIPLEN